MISSKYLLSAVLVGVCITRSASAFSPLRLPAVSRQARTLQSSSGDADDSTSVGDYVKGVHGGKYQFDDFGGSTYEGRQFAEALYSSGAVQEEAVFDGPIPSWAERMGTSSKLGVLTPLQKFPVISISSTTPASIAITNDERSWEYYFCKVVQISSTGAVLNDTAIWCHEQTSPLLATPAIGHLAPRGGSSNLCDPSKPYSDSATIQVSLNGAVDANPGNQLLLVVGTEAEAWCHWIQVEV